MSGHTTPLCILPFDRRASFERGMFGWSSTLSAKQSCRIAAAERVFYDGFIAAGAGVAPRENAGLLVVGQFGAGILRDARGRGCIACVSAVRSEQVRCDLEFDAKFARHIEAIAPIVCKALVRYNPERDAGMNRRQATRVRRLSEWADGSQSHYVYELPAPATPRQVKDVAADQRSHAQECRPALLVGAIRDLPDAGVEPDVWKVERLDRRGDYERVVVAAQRYGRRDVGCIVLDRAELDPHVSAARDFSRDSGIHRLRGGTDQLRGSSECVAGRKDLLRRRGRGD
jgi:myo-inositol catabolism protein IolC